MAKKRVKPSSSKSPRASAQSAWTYEEVQAIKTALWASPAPPTRAALPAAKAAAVAAAAATGPTLVAEGDSWFDYPPGMDILDWLKYEYHYSIIKLSAAGDTLENMVFGTGINRDFTRTTVQLETLIQTVVAYQPKAVLFSGGGNDIAGEPLEAFLEHKDSGILPLLRAGHVSAVIDGLFRAAYQTMAEKVWAVSPETHIITHGYAHSIPDGRGVFNFPFGFHFVGPWLKPAFCKKNILDLVQATGIAREIIDRFNAMLADIEQEYAGNPKGKFHYIDLRPNVGLGDWVNELHLTNQAYKRVAARFDAKLRAI